MQLNRCALVAGFIVLIALTVGPKVALGQDGGSRLAYSNGTGTLKVGAEEFQITSAIVKLFNDHKAEITLVSDITVFLSGTWSQRQGQQEFDIQITGGASAGGLEGSGKLLLGSDGKSIGKLGLNGVSRTTKRKVEAKFEAK